MRSLVLLIAVFSIAVWAQTPLCKETQTFHVHTDDGVTLLHAQPNSLIACGGKELCEPGTTSPPPLSATTFPSTSFVGATSDRLISIDQSGAAAFFRMLLDADDEEATPWGAASLQLPQGARIETYECRFVDLSVECDGIFYMDLLQQDFVNFDHLISLSAKGSVTTNGSSTKLHIGNAPAAQGVVIDNTRYAYTLNITLVPVGCSYFSYPNSHLSDQFELGISSCTISYRVQ